MDTYFEVTKIFYFADECFYGQYIDLKKFINYETTYDHLGIDLGLSHVRRFAHPYSVDSTVIPLLTKYGNSHYGPNRFNILNQRLNEKEYLEYLDNYYKIINRDFRVGLDKESGYIKFRKWSKGDVYPTSKNIYESLTNKSACLFSGHIFSYSEKWLQELETFV